MKQTANRSALGSHGDSGAPGRRRPYTPSPKGVTAMRNRSVLTRIRKLGAALATAIALTVATAGMAQAAAVVTTHKDENGWRLKVNGEDFFVKGVVWGYTPRNENYTYNLWGESDDFIRKVLDYEFGLMAAAGVNTIRSFAMIPPEWITYIYQ